MILAIRTTAGREKQVLEKLELMISKKKEGFYAMLAPHRVRGYLFIEAADPDEVAQLVYGVSHVKGLLGGEIKIDDINHFLAPSPKEIKIEANDVVEIISGPFKGEKARVDRINTLKEEVVVELLEAAVPIPITVKIDAVRVIRRESAEKEEGEA